MEFLQSYFEIVVEWVVELNIICFLLMFPLRKKKMFALRFVGGLLIACIVALPLTLFYREFGMTTWGRSITYAVLFSIIVLFFMFAYDDSFSRIILLADMGYVIQNMIYKVFMTFWGLMVFTGAAGPYGPTALQFKIIYYSVFAAQIAIYYFLFIRRAHKAVSDKQPATTILSMSMVIMFVMIVLCSLLDIYGDKITGGIYVFNGYESFALKQGSNLVMITMDVTLIFLLFSSTKKNDLEYDVEQLNFLVSQSEKQYNFTKDTIESINIKCHDMRHRIRDILNERNISPDTYDDVKKEIKIYDSKIKTGNSTLDVILTEKSLLCGHSNITFSCMADGNAVSFLEQIDLLCLFGNVLDNAIEASKLVPNEEERFILFSVNSIGAGMTKVECINRYEVAPKKEGENIITTKDDKANHGFGIKSIKNIAAKYNGSVEFKSEESIFTVTLVLYNTEN